MASKQMRFLYKEPNRRNKMVSSSLILMQRIKSIEVTINDTLQYQKHDIPTQYFRAAAVSVHFWLQKVELKDKN